MEIIVVAVLFVTVAITIFGFGAAVFAPASPMTSRLRMLLGQRRPQHQNVHERLEQVLEPLSKVLPQSGEKTAASTLLLVRAGYREPGNLTIYLGSRLLCAALLFVLTLASG